MLDATAPKRTPFPHVGGRRQIVPARGKTRNRCFLGMCRRALSSYHPETIMEPCDPTMVARARQGDVDAFGELFAATHRRIYNFVRQMVNDPEEAADVTQKIYVSAWRNLKSLRTDEAFLVWLHRIALNAARDVRKRPVRPTESLDAHDPEERPRLDIPDASAGPAERAALHDTQEFVRRAVRSLPDIHREVVTMHHLEGMEVTEIAAVLGVATGTVLSRLARAREALRAKLDELVRE